VTVVDANALDCRICWYPLNPPIFQVRARSHPPTFQMFLVSLKSFKPCLFESYNHKILPDDKLLKTDRGSCYLILKWQSPVNLICDNLTFCANPLDFYSH
jgi:hypothetical protein